jgi:hypothetical protein
LATWSSSGRGPPVPGGNNSGSSLSSA